MKTLIEIMKSVSFTEKCKEESLTFIDDIPLDQNFYIEIENKMVLYKGSPLSPDSAVRLYEIFVKSSTTLIIRRYVITSPTYQWEEIETFCSDEAFQKFIHRRWLNENSN